MIPQKIYYLPFIKAIPDRMFISIQYFYKTGRILHLNNPKRFNEKLQWIKLYNRDPEYTKMVDKYAVKDYLTPIIGREHIIPLLGVWSNFDDIDFELLPSQFVLKTTHGSGGIFICRNKNELNIENARQILNKALSRNYYYLCREWPYKNVPPRIIAEKYIQDGLNQNLTVYKVFNFDGEPFLIQTIQNDKTKEETVDYFDLRWNKLNLRQNYPNSKTQPKKPDHLDLIITLSKLCSKGIPFVRTDWYEANGKVYFSEYTFFSDAGHEPFYPDYWDLKLGEMTKLPILQK